MRAVIGLGTNLGDRVGYLVQAREALEAIPDLRIEAASSIVETDAHGPPQPRYLNAALRIETSLEVDALLDVCLAVERALGRVRAERWGPRTIDLDILWFDGREIHTDRVDVPHPRLLERPFALGPLLEVMPELVPLWGPVLHALGGSPRAFVPDQAPVKGWTSFDRRT